MTTPPKTSPTPVTILYADDDADDGMIFADLVSELAPSIQVDQVFDGTEVLALLEKRLSLPELIVMDMNMPRMTGLACLAELKKHDRFQSIPVIMYSTVGNPDTVNAALKNGAAGFRVKPNSYASMRTALADLLSQYNLM